MNKKNIINPLIANIYSLTPMQEGMLYHNIADGKSTSYVIQNIFELSGDVYEERIIKVLKVLVTRHEVLRTAIVHEKLAVPRQVILKNREAEYERIDLSGLSESEQEKKIADNRLPIAIGKTIDKQKTLTLKLKI